MSNKNGLQSGLLIYQELSPKITKLIEEQYPLNEKGEYEYEQLIQIVTLLETLIITFEEKLSVSESIFNAKNNGWLQ